MKLHLEYALTADDYYDFNRAYKKNRRSLTPPGQASVLWPMRIVLVIGVMLGVGLFSLPSLVVKAPAPAGPAGSSVASLTGVFLGFLPPMAMLIFFFLSLQFFLRSKYFFRRLAVQSIRVGEPRSAEITESGIMLREPGAVMQMEWHYFMRFIEAPSVFLLFTMPRVAHIIPKRAFASREQMDAFRALAQSRVGNQPIGFPVQPAIPPSSHA